MNTRNINTIKLKIQIAILTMLGMTLALALLPTIASAHGGEEHVTGIVTQVSDTSVTVKTTAGKEIVVAFDPKTTYARAKQPVQKADIKVGDRIVIHAMEIDEKLFAHTVELGGAHK